MTCFTVQVLEPSGKIIEVETCAGDNISNIILENYTSPNISISSCLVEPPVTDILGGSGIYIVNNSGIFTISTTGVPYIDNQGNFLTYINIDGGIP